MPTGRVKEMPEYKMDTVLHAVAEPFFRESILLKESML